MRTGRKRATGTDAQQDLVGLAQRGDPEAFRALYDTYVRKVSNYLYVALRNRDDADEVTQAVFLKVFVALPNYTQDEPFERWLFTIVRNAAINHRSKTEWSHPAAPDRVDEQRDRAGWREPLASPSWGSTADVHETLASLPAAQREVLVLHYLAGLTYTEIAAVLDRPTVTVRQLKRRALSAIRAGLGTR
jgi:RNA polymerase sigma-70 factor (ECF subfamily)